MPNFSLLQHNIGVYFVQGEYTANAKKAPARRLLHDAELSAIATACLNAGRHVLVEKPGGRNIPRYRP
jgi:hypothetical protein